MKNRRKWIVMGIIAIAVVIAGIVVYNNEKQKAAERAAEAKRIEEQEKAREAAQKAAEEYRAQAQKLLEEGKYDEAQEAMGKALEQTPEDEELAAASEELNQKAEEMKGYNATMEAALAAIQEDDAEALDQLQDSEEGKALEAMAEGEGSYLYFPEGGSGTDGKGIGFYVFEDCSLWYYGDYVNGKREGKGIWYYTSSHTEDGSLYKEVYQGDWKEDAPNGKGHQYIALGDKVDTDKRFKVKDGLFYGAYKIKDKLEDGTEVSGKYKLKKGKYVTISDEELEQNNFVVPEEPHLAIAFLYDGKGNVRSCTMIYAEDATKGVKQFY